MLRGVLVVGGQQPTHLLAWWNQGPGPLLACCMLVLDQEVASWLCLVTLALCLC